jgi:hypothetical protein
VCFFLAVAASAAAQSAVDATHKEMIVTTKATGTFEVKINPIGAYNDAADALLGRMSLDKQFHGELEGTGKGEMLTAGSPVEGSAGYVAVERITGTLHGRRGTFALIHRGIMTRGTPELIITVVPDSGTGELVGLTGTMMINIADGKHSYDFEYALPKSL